MLLIKKNADIRIKEWLDFDTFNIILAGDFQSLKPKLEALKYRVEKIDENGNIIRDKK
ncbi:MAG: hypothetical protein UZ11_BCD004001991 [Bacteroidetes bacterium OLB11]|nr:MAG: hypothetical protein UZ11_BCD004001991 [Bacteroidetes bacterium OLB11]